MPFTLWMLFSYGFFNAIFFSRFGQCKRNETHPAFSQPFFTERTYVYYKLPITVVLVIIVTGSSIFISRLVNRVYNNYKDNWAVRADVTDVSDQTKDLIRNQMRLAASLGFKDSAATNAWLQRYIDIWIQRVANKRASRVSNADPASHRSNSIRIESVSDSGNDVTAHVVVIEVDSSQGPAVEDIARSEYI